ncbi:CLUMA_CG014812, isoform A, partial [Clunio marinus]
MVVASRHGTSSTLECDKTFLYVVCHVVSQQATRYSVKTHKQRMRYVPKIISEKRISKRKKHDTTEAT